MHKGNDSLQGGEEAKNKRRAFHQFFRYFKVCSEITENLIESPIFIKTMHFMIKKCVFYNFGILDRLFVF